MRNLQQLVVVVVLLVNDAPAEHYIEGWSTVLRSHR